jgi:rRNA-processing protein FCF1
MAGTIPWGYYVRHGYAMKLQIHSNSGQWDFLICNKYIVMHHAIKYEILLEMQQHNEMVFTKIKSLKNFVRTSGLPMITLHSTILLITTG